MAANKLVGRRVFDDEDALDEDDEGPGSHGGGIKRVGGARDDGEEAEEEEEDELEAFMRGNAAQVKHDESVKKTAVAVRDDIEEEDELEKYINLMKAKGIDVGNMPQQQSQQQGDDVDSDEEVYRAAKAADAGGGAADDSSLDGPQRRDVEPLPPVDHSLNDYIGIAKDFYEEHADIAALTPDQVGEIRRRLDMRVYGPSVPKPCLKFDHFGFDDALMKTIAAHGYTEPTSIQKQAISVALSGRDIIGVAKTGSGKTAAYLLPMIVHLMDQPELEKGDGPIGIVLAPTRELCVQIHQEAKKFAKAYNLKVWLDKKRFQVVFFAQVCFGMVGRVHLRRRAQNGAVQGAPERARDRRGHARPFHRHDQDEGDKLQARLLLRPRRGRSYV